MTFRSDEQRQAFFARHRTCQPTRPVALVRLRPKTDLSLSELPNFKQHLHENLTTALRRDPGSLLDKLALHLGRQSRDRLRRDEAGLRRTLQRVLEADLAPAQAAAVAASAVRFAAIQDRCAVVQQAHKAAHRWAPACSEGHQDALKHVEARIREGASMQEAIASHRRQSAGHPDSFARGAQTAYADLQQLYGGQP